VITVGLPEHHGQTDRQTDRRFTVASPRVVKVVVSNVIIANVEVTLCDDYVNVDGTSAGNDRS